MASAAGPPVNPFPGLRPFREDEAHLFFGRENQVDAMVDKLGETHFLAVIGTSGSGKSSLVNCGLRPALRQGLMARAGTAWRMVQFRPGNDPIGAMARALAQEGVLFAARAPATLTMSEVVETTLRMSKLGLVDICQQAALGEGVNLLLVVDQFEELFRYRQLVGTGSVAEDAAAFVNLLLEVKAHPESRIFVVLTMRSDFLGDCTQFLGLAEAINAGQYLVPRMTRDERRDAIVRPVGVGGAEMAPVLLTRLVNDVGGNPDQLSILQHALNRTWALWEKAGGEGPLAPPYYEAIGTMDHALDRHADEAYAEFEGRQKHVAEKLFKALTDKATDPRGIRRPTTVATLCALCEATPEEIASVIDVFRHPSRSFLMPPAGEPLRPETVIDISHESLMRVWRKLSDWAEEEARSSRTYLNLAEAADEHAAGKRSLWRDPELQLALDWQEKDRPNEVWASRYHHGFAAAQQFLMHSSDARDAERSERQRQRQRELEAQQEKAATQARNARRRGWVAIFFAGVAVIVGYLGWKAKQASETAERKEKEASNNLSESQIMQSRWLINRAEQSTDQSTRILLALEALPSAQELTDAQGKRARPVYEEAQRRLVKWLDDFRHSKVIKGHEGPINSVAMTANGGQIVSGSDDKTVRLWDAKGTELHRLKGHSAPVRSVAVTSDGRRTVSGSDDQTARLWDANGLELRRLEGHAGPVSSVAITSTGSHVVTGSDDRTARLWDVVRGTAVELNGHADSVTSVAITPDGRYVATGSKDGTVYLWDAAGVNLGRFEVRGSVTSVVLKPDGKRVAAGGSGGIAYLWQASGDLLSATRPTEAVDGIALAEDILITVSEQRVRLWRQSKEQPLQMEELLQMNGHTDTVRGVAATPDGLHIVTGSADTTIRLWDKETNDRSSGRLDSLPRLIAVAIDSVQRCLTIDERLAGLKVIPPNWCIDHKKEPYDTSSWAAWRAKKKGTIDADLAKEFANTADALLKSGDFSAALDIADLGLEFDPQQTWITINKSHALMFLDRLDDADKEHLKYRGTVVDVPGRPPRKWEEWIEEDFDVLRAAGRCHPHMTDVARKLGRTLKESTDCQAR